MAEGRLWSLPCARTRACRGWAPTLLLSFIPWGYYSGTLSGAHAQGYPHFPPLSSLTIRAPVPGPGPSPPAATPELGCGEGAAPAGAAGLAWATQDRARRGQRSAGQRHQCQGSALQGCPPHLCAAVRGGMGRGVGRGRWGIQGDLERKAPRLGQVQLTLQVPSGREEASSRPGYGKGCLALGRSHPILSELHVSEGAAGLTQSLPLPRLLQHKPLRGGSFCMSTENT